MRIEQTFHRPSVTSAVRATLGALLAFGALTAARM
jgi:hypothetical protein